MKRVEAAGIDTRNALATWIDGSVGAVLRQLEDKGPAGNTVVIGTSGHRSRGKSTC